MFRTVESHSVGDHETNIGNDFLCVIIARIMGIRIRLLRIGGSQLALDGRDVHGGFDNRRIMGDVESDRVDRTQERSTIFAFSEAADGGYKEAILVIVNSRLCMLRQR